MWKTLLQLECEGISGILSGAGWSFELAEEFVSPSGRRPAYESGSQSFEDHGRLSSGAESGNYDAYSDDVSRRLDYKGCVVSGMH